MQPSRNIPARLAFLGLATCLALPALSQTDIDAATQAVPEATQNAERPAPPAASPPLWASPADIIQDKPATISPARATEADILSCPFEVLRAAYLSLYAKTDALNVAALESEVFKVCIARQKQVKLLLDNEERLRTQLGDIVPPTTVAHPQFIAPQIIPSQIIASPSEAEIAKSEVADVAAPMTLVSEPPISTPNQPKTFRATKSSELAQSALQHCADRYTSGPIFGAATLDGGLHAFVYDAQSGTERSVKAGDTLPGGLTIARISTKDGVIVSEQGVERPLVRTLTEPAFDDGGGLLFKTVSMADVYKIDDTDDGSQDSTWEALE